MAITPTPNNSLFKGFVFDGVDSRDYGVYISGDAVFNAPERDVEMIEIPGRNGAFALDKGRFSNIEVTYPAGLFGNSEADFAAGINALRNALASRKGYCRLEDDYNPNEYRMAVYKSGLDVTPARLKAGQFNIVFECKPQRFLKSGEAAQTVTSGGTITNPTLFEAKPLIEAEGYGNIFINDGKLTVYNIPMGTISLPYERVSLTDDSLTYTIGNLDLLENGDTIYFTGAQLGDYPWFNLNGGGTTFDPCYPHLTSSPYDNNNIVSSGGSITYWTWSATPNGIFRPYIKCILPTMTFTYGTQSSTSYYCQYTVVVNANAGDPAVTPSYTTTVRETFTTNYDGAGEITILYGLSYGSQMTLDSRREYYSAHANEGVTANSTKSVNGTIYFDLDVAEAYIDQDGTITSANNIVEIPAVPPALESGNNVITYDNTITSLKVTPRWWEV